MSKSKENQEILAELDKKSSECSQKIIFNLLDKKKSLEESRKDIEECLIHIKAFKQKTFEIHEYKEEDYTHLFN